MSRLQKRSSPDPVALAPTRTGHSGLGASGMARWMHCPGSYRLSQQAPKRRASVWAATGTIAHDLVELTLVTGDRAALRAKCDEVLVLDGHEVTLSADLIQGVELMVDYVESVRDKYDEVLIEHTVSLDRVFPPTAPPPEPLYGRTDVLMLNENALEVVDFKNGRGVLVSVEDNPQLMYYAAGALLSAQLRTIEHVRMTVVQPHAETAAKIRTCEVSAIDVMLWIDDVLIPAVRAAAQPDAPLVMGQWCRFCPALAECPRMFDLAQQAAAREFLPYTPEGQTDFAQLLEVAEQVETWAREVRWSAEEMVRAKALTIPGWGLVPKRATRQWADPHAVMEVCAAGGVSSTDLIHSALRSPAQLEHRVPALVWEALQQFITKVSSGDKLDRVVSNPASPSESDFKPVNLEAR
jgi:hypothetical protein